MPSQAVLGISLQSLQSRDGRCYNFEVAPEDLNRSASRLRTLRLANGLTQEELARRLGVSFVTVNRWENGRTHPGSATWEELEKLRPAGAAEPWGHGRAGELVGRVAEMRMIQSLVAGKIGRAHV